MITIKLIFLGCFLAGGMFIAFHSCNNAGKPPKLNASQAAMVDSLKSAAPKNPEIK